MPPLRRHGWSGFEVFLREAGARINDYVGEPSDHPSHEELAGAARALAPGVLVAEDDDAPGVEDPAVIATLERELVAQGSSSSGTVERLGVVHVAVDQRS